MEPSYKKAKGSAGISGAKGKGPKTKMSKASMPGLSGTADSRPPAKAPKQSAR